MGLFRLVARVGCLRGGAIRLLEEWPHIPLRRVDRTRLTDPLAFSLPHEVAPAPRASLSGRYLWRKRNDRTTGDFRAGAVTARRATPSPCASATATAATSRATGPRRNRRTAPSAGISASATPPNTIATGIISKGLTAEDAAAREADEQRDAERLPPGQSLWLGRPRRRQPQPRRDARARRARARGRRRLRGDQGRLSPPRQGQPSRRRSPATRRPPRASS